MLDIQESFKRFIEIQEITKPTMSIEVGAFFGEFSREMSKNIPAYAFEASPYVYERIKEGIGNVSYINKAITNYEGYAEFYWDKDTDVAESGHNGIIPHMLTSNLGSTTVECTSLDIYFKDITAQKIALWIDCEGSTREVLLGADRILDMVDSIHIEVEVIETWKDQWLRDDIVKYLKSKGFTLFIEYYACLEQTNCIFVRSNNFVR